MSRTLLLIVFLACLAVPARASVSYTVVLDALLYESSAAVVATPIDQRSVWEDGRIATYTKVRVDRVVAGSVPSDVWIRTLGGIVGDIGQQVEGEAVLRVGQTSLLFLKSFSGSLVVTARGQGQFVVVSDTTGSHLRKNLRAGALVAPNQSSVSRIRAATANPNAILPAADVLDGKSINDAVTEITAAWARTHA